ncbi:MAG: D-aminoacyl-tRNA deacylase [Gammaproteobacteria bacterium]|jgi:D-tyrosyl-tRNA(Tyr) deacylase|nr:D-aminoacyl-tRNA deacylase [Gammaproteobacteria bacterium]
MILLLQRVTSAAVTVDDNCIAEIGVGILALCGFERDDDEAICARMAERLLRYRLFSDSHDKMNLSLLDVQGELLLVPQFTLAADTRNGNRASFSGAAAPAVGAELFEHFSSLLKSRYQRVLTGRFGANMQVALVNDGPVTFWLQLRN